MLRRRRRERAGRAEPGVVDEQGERRQRRDPVDDPLDALVAAEVGREHLRLDRVPLAELRRERVQPRLVARHQDQIVPAGRELPGERRADPGGGAR